MAVRTRPPGPTARSATLDRAPRARASRLQPAPRRRPGDGRTCSLRRLPPGGAAAPGPQEARADPGRRRLARTRPARGTAPRASNAGYEHLEVVIDDASRYTVVVPVPDETAASAVHGLEVAAAEFARLGIRIERVLTDNGAGYRSHAYRDALTTLGARHKRTRPWRPQTNGKAERVIQTLLREWTYGRLYTSNRERADALPVFVDFYNRRRPHTALRGRSPLDAVNKVLGDYT